jgi:predicted O-linked N-acetylglucosamine transferase (SPINDLY family)
MAPSAPSLADALKRAMEALRAGRLDEAARHCKAAVKARPDSFDALHLMGLVEARRGDAREAQRLIARAIKLNPKVAAAHLNLGNALAAQGRHAEAVESYGRALALNPGYAEACANRGAALHALRRLDDAAADLRRAVELKPDYAGAHNNLGNVLKDQGRLDAAVEALNRAIALKPGYADAYVNLGDALLGQDRHEDAAEAYRRAAELDPADPQPHDKAGQAWYAAEDFPKAIAAFDRALELRTKARPAGERVLEICAGLFRLIEAPQIPGSEEAAAASRRRFAEGLARLGELARDFAGPAGEHDQALLTGAAFKVNNFALGYHLEDDVGLQRDYAQLLTRLLQPQLRAFLKPMERRRGAAKIRVGVASELLRLHNGAKWTYGWLKNLPPQDYEFFFYSLQGAADALTARMAALGTYRWLPFREATYVEALKAIRADRLDVLIVPDIGMTVSSRIISLARLAPVQCMTCGHPVTSGSPTIDYFLSGALVEPPDGGAHCTETVVRLPNMGVQLDASDMDAPPAARADFGLPEDRPVLGSVQGLMKYHPRYDGVFPNIAKQAPEALFVFVGARSQAMTGAFAARLKRAFERSGLDFAHHVRILPFMPHARFVQLFDALDASLDTIGWSGGNTTAQALWRHCPVVTMRGRFMRGWFSHGMMRMAGLEELSVESEEAYVALALRLIRDKAFRAAVSQKIAANKHGLFGDMECVRGLDAFFKKTAIAAPTQS